MHPVFHGSWRWCFPALVLAGQAVLWSLDQRGQSDLVLLGYGISSIGWLGLLWSTWSRQQTAALVLFGMALRATWLTVPPLLSDDWYRYLWDGLIAYQGGNPFDALPSSLPELSPRLLDGMNSPDYYSVYPPFAQVLFRSANAIGGGQIESSLLALRVFFLAFDTLALWLFWRLCKGSRMVLVYAMAPLAIVETAGNVHLEGVSIAGVLLAVWAWQEGLRRSRSSTPSTEAKAGGPSWPWFALGLLGFWIGLATKLTPLILLPLFPPLLGWRRGLVLGTGAIALLLLSFLPFWNAEFIDHFSSSLDLYFRRFEFNEGLYAVGRWISVQWTGYPRIDIVGPVLGLVSALGILALALLRWPRHPQAWFKTAFWMVAIHQLTATIMHPWYILPLLAWNSFGAWRFALVWAALIPTTYAAYAGGDFYPPYGWIALEYGLVWSVLVLELVLHRRRRFRANSEQ